MSNLFCLRAGIDGTGLHVPLEFFTLFRVFMVAVRIWGALEGSQPITGTLEIGFRAVLIVVTLPFLPSGGA
ncbi:hypothetical protein [Actibacterium sp. 188UL27-1]|uniref:hypothetical protein n=1 Tax=Actibacterium sp. 188UL27-1 TaxID=2786961 RepID=UPI001959B337|nr:hypothetical protein [Actibacterium sp. 188UL27-1]MBM7068417.1 hypothetical protein [Actibacterium sp. 188UL27-1]